MKKISIIACTLALAACGDDTMNENGTGTGAGNGNGNGIPTRPALGNQIDRHGRAAVTTALISTFAEEAEKGAARDAYNAAGPSEWTDFTADIQANLAILDALDTDCGNQVLADADPANRYGVLAGALADDRLYVNTAAASCGQYLAVELNATGVIPNGDCGGRTPGYDVGDVTYSALAIGMPSGVTDGVDEDDANPSDSVFPFLAAP